MNSLNLLFYALQHALLCPDSNSYLAHIAPSLLLSFFPPTAVLFFSNSPPYSLYLFSSLLLPCSTPSPLLLHRFCQSLRPALTACCRRSPVCLRFTRWTHSSLSPFLPRRVPRWLRSPFAGWASGGKPWWRLLLGSCWSWSWWFSFLCWWVLLAQVAQLAAAVTSRCWAPAGWFATPSPAPARRVQKQIQSPQVHRSTKMQIWAITVLAHPCRLTAITVHKEVQDIRASLDPQGHLESQAHQVPRDHREIVWTL